MSDDGAIYSSVERQNLGRAEHAARMINDAVRRAGAYLPGMVLAETWAAGCEQSSIFAMGSEGLPLVSGCVVHMFYPAESTAGNLSDTHCESPGWVGVQVMQDAPVLLRPDRAGRVLRMPVAAPVDDTVSRPPGAGSDR